MLKFSVNINLYFTQQMDYLHLIARVRSHSLLNHHIHIFIKFLHSVLSSELLCSCSVKSMTLLIIFIPVIISTPFAPNDIFFIHLIILVIFSLFFCKCKETVTLRTTQCRLKYILNMYITDTQRTKRLYTKTLLPAQPLSFYNDYILPDPTPCSHCQ